MGPYRAMATRFMPKIVVWGQEACGVETQDICCLGRPDMCCLGRPDMCCLGKPDMCSLGRSDMCCLGTPDMCCLGTPDMPCLEGPDMWCLGRPDIAGRTRKPRPDIQCDLLCAKQVAPGPNSKPLASPNLPGQPGHSK